jgi:hypothetical protein
MSDEDEVGSAPWRAIPRVAGGIVAAPVVVGFVVLGAAVLVMRSLRDVAREAWALIPGRRTNEPPPAEASPERDSHAA